MWLSWTAPDTSTLLLPSQRASQVPADRDGGEADRLNEQVRHILLPSAQDQPEAETTDTTDRESYFDETDRSGNVLHEWRQLLVMLVSFEMFTPKGLKALVALKPFRTGGFAAPSGGDGRVDAGRRPYVWTNSLSVYYANMYRSAFVVAYMLAAVAVLCALVSVWGELSPDLGVGAIRVPKWRIWPTFSDSGWSA